MKRKAVSEILLLLLLSGMLTLAFKVQPAKTEWTGTVYIRADGSVDPSTAPILNDGNIYYTLTNNLYGSIVIERDNIVIDGADYTLDGTNAPWGSKGISLSGRTGVTIKNMKIKSFFVGIELTSSNNNSIFKNIIIDNVNSGLYLGGSTNNNLYENNLSNNGVGITLNYCSNNKITDNNIVNNNIGINFHYYSFNNFIYHNNLRNTEQVHDVHWDLPQMAPSINIWDNGYPSGGNYWSDYTGDDNYSGPNQDQSGSDGIGDTPYIIDDNNVDRYPLINLWTPTPENQPPNPPTDLGQFTTDGTPLDVGATILQTTVMFKGKISDPNGDKVKLQIELRRLNEFDGQFNETAGGFKESELVKSGSIVTVYAYGLIAGNYHWRARTVDEHGLTSGWVDFGDNPISNADFRIPKVLPVPYYYQGNTEWCVPTSMSMIFKYYGQNIHSWDIAKDWNWGRNIEWWKFWQPTRGMIQDYLSTHGLETEDGPIDFSIVKAWIDDGAPVLAWVSWWEKSDLIPIKRSHVVVIVGYAVGEMKKIYVNDPGGTLVAEKMGLPVSYPFAAVEVDWNCFKEYVDSDVELMGVRGLPYLPKGTIDIVDKGFYFCYPQKPWLEQVYDWLYGKDKGLIWEHYPRHPLALNSRDYFTFKGFIVNHMAIEQRYLLQVEFTEINSQYTFSFWKEISVPGFTGKSNIVEPIPLREVLTRTGEYTITLKLWNEDGTEKYDEVVFPPIKYTYLLEFQLASSAHLYITDPQGRSIGIDPSTGELVNEISGAIYAYSDVEPELIAIPDPIDGNYLVELTGISSGTYNLTARLVTLEAVLTYTFIGNITEDEVQQYTTFVSREIGKMRIVSWEYSYEDQERGTILRISTNDGLFQFITQDKDYGIKNATYMKVCRRTIFIWHRDDELSLITLALDNKFDFCIAIAWDIETHTKYFLIDKVGLENQL